MLLCRETNRICGRGLCCTHLVLRSLSTSYSEVVPHLHARVNFEQIKNLLIKGGVAPYSFATSIDNGMDTRDEMGAVSFS